MFVFVLLLLPLLTITAHGDHDRDHDRDRACVYNCSCVNDTTCKFYCGDGRCQYSIPLFKPCLGYQVHPRECGKFQWCNPSTKQCERGKSEYYYCQYDYECLSNHCSKKGVCKTESEAYNGTIVPSVIAGILFLTIIIIVISYQKRIAALKRRLATPFIINPAAGINREKTPPPYGSVPLHNF